MLLHETACRDTQRLPCSPLVETEFPNGSKWSEADGPVAGRVTCRVVVKPIGTCDWGIVPELPPEQ